MVKKNFLMTAPLLMASFCSAQEKPNVVLIMVDDMGYSDIGCYGGEILTPNIDALASKGVRFTQFYNTSRSCPARASLMTGLYQHQAGIGQMSEDPFKNPGQKSPNDWGVPGYKGFLNRNCVTIAEVLKEGGYHTYMAGKWHLGMHGEEKWPLQRGFERFYGILAGACSYLRPSGGRGLTLDNTKLPEPEAPYYTTDAFTDYAIRFVDEQKDDKPFFLYLAFNAPHWPLQAIVDGESFKPVLTGKKKTHKKYSFSLQTTRGINAGSPYYGIRSVYDGRYRYIVNLTPEATFQNVETKSPLFKEWKSLAKTDSHAKAMTTKYQHRPAIELYDVKNDPYCMKNLAEDAKQASTISRLDKELKRWMKDCGDEGQPTEMRAFEHMPGKRK